LLSSSFSAGASSCAESSEARFVVVAAAADARSFFFTTPDPAALLRYRQSAVDEIVLFVLFVATTPFSLNERKEERKKQRQPLYQSCAEECVGIGQKPVGSADDTVERGA
jgi:hypothetical protein